jgi:hypothetical protein
VTKLPEFTHRLLDALPGDARTDTEPRQVHGALWSRVQPTPVSNPRLLAFSRPLARELGLDETLMQDPNTARVLGGNALWPGMDPYAANYGGHQFGNWAGQLGDGRAIVLGELVRPDGVPSRSCSSREPDHGLLATRRRARRAAFVDPQVPLQRERCSTSACRRRARCRSSRPATTSCATCSTTAIRSTNRARSSAAWRRTS